MVDPALALNEFEDKVVPKPSEEEETGIDSPPPTAGSFKERLIVFTQYYVRLCSCGILRHWCAGMNK